MTEEKEQIEIEAVRCWGSGGRNGKKQSSKNYFTSSHPHRDIIQTFWHIFWHHIAMSYSSYILTFFVIKSGEDEEERKTLMKSRALRSLDFTRVILSSSSLLPVGVGRWPLRYMMAKMMTCWSFWHIVLRTIFLTFFLAYLRTFILPYLLTFFLTFFLSYLLTFFLTYLLTCLLTFFLTFFLTYFLTHLLTFFLAYLQTLFLAFLLSYLLTLFLTFFLSFFLSYLLTSSDILSDISSDMSCDILSDICSDISSDILSDILSDISCRHIFWHIFWHVFWHSFWHIFWHSFWHIFWQVRLGLCSRHCHWRFPERVCCMLDSNSNLTLVMLDSRQCLGVWRRLDAWKLKFEKLKS